MSTATVQLGAIGRLGRFSASHARAVAIAWIVIAVGLGFLAPRVETALSGAGWEATGSDSVAARTLIQQHFAGNASTGLMVVLHSSSLRSSDASFAAVTSKTAALVKGDPAVTGVTLPAAGVSISRDGHTVIVTGRAARSPKQMVLAAHRLKGPLARSRHLERLRQSDGRVGHVVGLQRGQPLGHDEERALLVAGDAGDPAIRVRLAGGREPPADAHDRRPGRLGRRALPRHAVCRHLDLVDELRAHVRARSRH